MAGETTLADGYTGTAYKGGAGELCVLDVSHEFTTGELELADVVKFGKVPQGAIYVGGYIASDDLDSGAGACELLVGDTTDDDGLLATGGGVGASAAVTTLSGTDITNARTTTQEETVSVKVGTAPRRLWLAPFVWWFTTARRKRQGRGLRSSPLFFEVDT